MITSLGIHGVADSLHKASYNRVTLWAAAGLLPGG